MALPPFLDAKSATFVPRSFLINLPLFSKALNNPLLAVPVPRVTLPKKLPILEVRVSGEELLTPRPAPKPRPMFLAPRARLVSPVLSAIPIPSVFVKPQVASPAFRAKSLVAPSVLLCKILLPSSEVAWPNLPGISFMPVCNLGITFATTVLASRTCLAIFALCWSLTYILPGVIASL